MKVCLVASNSLRVSPYVRKYAKLLDEQSITYDIISKEHIREKEIIGECDNIYFYKDVRSPLGKFLRFVGYADYVKQKLRNGSYDKAVFFTGMNAAFAYFRFGKEMKKRLSYILDIRDYDTSFTDILISPYLKKAVRDAEAVVVSSAKFMDWLPPKESIFVMHNLPNNAAKKERSAVFQNAVTRIGYLGGINYFEQNRFLVDQLRDDNRFVLTYRGMYPSGYSIREYCAQQHVKNAEFFGRYSEDEKDELYQSVDIINAVYGNNSLVVTTALPNKLYDCVYYKIPIMVNSGTYLSEIVERYSLGFSVSIDEDCLSDKIISYITNFDRGMFEKGCAEFLEYAESEQQKTDDRIRYFFSKEV